jgi:periodic tryptophan protein 1
MEKTAVTSICWVPRGKCKAKPLAAAEDDEELRAAHDALMGGAASSSEPVAMNTEGLEEFGLENYDEDDENDGGMQFFSVLKQDGELARQKDEFLTGDPNSDSDSDDYHEIRPEDMLFCAVSCEEETCTLEMYVYDDDEANMYVHHDIMLDAYPLCVDWLPKISGEDAGSFAAIGLIDHQIQIWDLDRLDPLAPIQSLGAAKKDPKSKLKKKKGKEAKAKGGTTAHEGPVLALHGSVFNRSVLASGSGDETVKIWDVAENNCVHTYTHHSNKVQCVKWHPTEQAVLLSASFDRRLALLDVRQPGQACTVELPAEAESAIWSRHNPFECFASVDNGGVVCYDVRKVASKAADPEKVVWQLMAHDVACTSVQDVPVPNLLVTSSLDGHAKIWNIDGGKPSLAMAKNLQAGPLFACQSNPEAPALVTFGGNVPVVWDLASEDLLGSLFNFGDKPASDS